MSQERKRINTFVDVATYERLKRILDAMGMTVTDFINQAMIDFVENMESIIENQDREAFLQMVTKNIDSIQKQVEHELKK
ncbi:MAG: hypothetical protein ACRDD7_02595 [Peptostreptococcaceae bacterium]